MTRASIGRVVIGLWMVFVTALAGLPLATRVTAPAAVPQGAQAASGAAVPVQLRLSDAGGPLTGTVNLQLRLFNAASGGSLLLLEDKPSTAVVGGIVSVLIGETAPVFGSVASAFSSTNASVWLEVTAAANILNPRVQIGSAPFAFAIPDGSIGNVKLTDFAVTSAKLFTDSVNTGKIQDGQVQTADLQDGAVSNAKLGTGLDGGKLTAGSVANAQLGSGIDGAKLQAPSVANDKLASGIDAAKITVGSMSGDRVTVNSLNGDRIVAASIPAGKLAADSVSSANISSGAVGASDIANNGFGASSRPLLSYVPVVPRLNAFYDDLVVPTGTTSTLSAPAQYPTAKVLHVVIGVTLLGTGILNSESTGLFDVRCDSADPAVSFAADAGTLLASVNGTKTRLFVQTGTIPVYNGQFVCTANMPTDVSARIDLHLIGYWENASTAP